MTGACRARIRPASGAGMAHAWDMPRASLLVLAAAALLAGCSSSSPLDHHPWAFDFADLNGAATTRLAVSPSEQVALAGSFSSQLDVGPAMLDGSGMGDNDVFVGMLGSDGRPVWSGGTGSTGDQRAYGVAFAPDGSVVTTGGFTNTVNFGTGVLTAVSNDIFLVKLAPSGKTTWALQFGADLGAPDGIGSGTPASVAVDASGNVALGGSFTGTIGFGGAPIHASPQAPETSFVAKVDGKGQHVYSLAFGGQGHQVDAVAFDAAGNLLVAGLDEDSLTIGSDSFTTTSGAGFLAKLDPSGQPLWARQLEGLGSSQSLALAVDDAGDVVVGGVFATSLEIGDLSVEATTSQDGFVLGVSADGAPQWLKALPGALVTALAFEQGGTVLVSGAYEGSPDFGGGPLPQQVPAGAFVTRLNAIGDTVLATLTFGQPENESLASGIAPAGADVVVGGNFTGPFVIGGKTFQAAAGGDLFVARLTL